MVKPLYEGTFSVGLDKKFIRIKKSDPPHKGSLKLSINPFLIISDEERNYLFDAGLGDFGEDTSTQTMKDNLGKEGLSDFEITDIFVSHLHYDHIGGLADRENGYWQLTFPDARLWVSMGGWQKALTYQEKTDDELNTEFIHFLDAKADIHFLDEDDQPYPDIRVKKIGGHTEFSQLLIYETKKEKYLMAGDVIGTRNGINRKFAAKYDFDPKHSMTMRKELKKLALRENYIILAYHETDHPMFRLTGFDEQKGYIINNIDN